MQNILSSLLPARFLRDSSIRFRLACAEYGLLRRKRIEAIRAAQAIPAETKRDAALRRWKAEALSRTSPAPGVSLRDFRLAQKAKEAAERRRNRVPQKV